MAEFILSHHERWDGKGYPRGLKGEEIPLLCRILAVVDAYDAMTSDRVYRKAMSKEEALEELKNNVGTQFDPVITDIFIQLLSVENILGNTNKEKEKGDTWQQYLPLGTREEDEKVV